MFEAPTYIVLEVPPPVATAVLALRASYDLNAARLPAEITVAGSSGIGVLAPGQRQESAFEAIRRVGQRHLPFISSFASMERFTGTQVFWLKPRDRAPYDALQRSLIGENLIFRANPFPFNPHCTISATVKLTQQQESELLKSAVPMQEFTHSQLSVYQLVEGNATLLESFSFSP